MSNNINGVATGTLEWAKVLGDAPISEFSHAKGTWSVDVLVDDKERERLEALGLKGSAKNPNKFVFKKNAESKAGKPLSAPVVIDGDKNPWDTSKLIGNGSEGRVKFYAYTHAFEKQYGLGKGIDKLQVTNHVPYGDDGFDVVESVETVTAGDDDEF